MSQLINQLKIKSLILILLGLVSFSVMAKPVIGVFVSFSMPTNLLSETLKESGELNLPVYINGLFHNSMPETARKIMRLSAKVPNLNLQIDPTLFERYAITKVPAVVVEKNRHFDVIYGHLSIHECLQRIIDAGETRLSKLDLKEAS